MCCGARGLSSQVTEEGPPDRMIPFGFSRWKASSAALNGPLSISLPAVLQHLQALEASGLVRSEKSGRVRTCRIVPEALGAAENWISEQRSLWEARLDRFEDHVMAMKKEGNDNG